MTNPETIFKKHFYPAAFLLSCCFVCSCENSDTDIKGFINSRAMVEEATNIEGYLSQGGSTRAKLTAPVMLRVMADTQYLEFPNSLHADFYNDSTAKIETWVTSKYGKYYENLNKVYLRDSVVVITITGDTLKSSDLWWDQDKGIFYTYHYAEYHGKNQVINGNKGMEATQDLKTVSFKEPTGNIGVSEDKF